MRIFDFVIFFHIVFSLKAFNIVVWILKKGIIFSPLKKVAEYAIIYP
jgi:hypothetical protein